MADHQLSAKLSPRCPIRTTLDLLGGKWRLLIIQSLAGKKKMRYRDIKKDIPGISDKVLTDELRTMEENHLVERKAEDMNIVLYSLSGLGKEAELLIKPMARFGQVYKDELGL